MSALFMLAGEGTSAMMAAVDVLGLLKQSRGVILFVVVLLVALVPLAAFVIVYKLRHVTQAQSQSIRFLDRFWESKRLDEIYRSAQSSEFKHSPLAAMFSAGYVELSKVKKGREGAPAAGSMYEKMDGIENVERALYRARVSEMTRLEDLLPFLATTGSATPFIGLFGTVWGIMDAFAAIAASGKADLASVSQPIAEALVTTALALASAVPAVVAYNYFQRRIKVLGAEMQTFGTDFLNIVKRHFF